MPTADRGCTAVNTQVSNLPRYMVVALTGSNEANAVFRDTDTFFSYVVLGVPFTPLPCEPERHNISGQIEQHRDHVSVFEHKVDDGPPSHTRARSLLSRLITPSLRMENGLVVIQSAPSDRRYRSERVRVEVLVGNVPPPRPRRIRCLHKL